MELKILIIFLAVLENFRAEVEEGVTRSMTVKTTKCPKKYVNRVIRTTVAQKEGRKAFDKLEEPKEYVIQQKEAQTTSTTKSSDAKATKRPEIATRKQEAVTKKEQAKRKEGVTNKGHVTPGNQKKSRRKLPGRKKQPGRRKKPGRRKNKSGRRKGGEEDDDDDDDEESEQGDGTASPFTLGSPSTRRKGEWNCGFPAQQANWTFIAVIYFKERIKENKTAKTTTVATTAFTGSSRTHAPTTTKPYSFKKGRYKRAVPYCLGSLVAYRWVVTAGHCLPKKDKYNVAENVIKVRIGVFDMEAGDGETAEIENTFQHKNFINARVKYNWTKPFFHVVIDDIGLIFLSRRMENFHPIEPHRGFVPTNFPCYSIGWGFEHLKQKINNQTTYQNHLPLRGLPYEIRMKPVYFGECTEFIKEMNDLLVRSENKSSLASPSPDIVRKKFICANRAFLEEPYYNDMGAPLVCNGKLYGVAIVINDLTIFTRLATLMQWMNETIVSNGKMPVIWKSFLIDPYGDYYVDMEIPIKKSSMGVIVDLYCFIMCIWVNKVT